MPSQTKQNEERLAREILSYFLRHPQSADDLEGVARWRLLDETIYRALEETSRALDWLVCEGYLEKASVRGSDQIYSVNPRKREEAEDFLRGKEPPEAPDS